MDALYAILNDDPRLQKTLTVAATLDFPSIAAVGTQALTVSVPGARVGDLVVLGLPDTVNNGVVFDARVSAADTVTVRALNITAGAIDPASASYRVSVIKIF